MTVKLLAVFLFLVATASPGYSNTARVEPQPEPLIDPDSTLQVDPMPNQVAVPEPSTIALAFVGLAGFAALKLRRRRSP